MTTHMFDPTGLPDESLRWSPRTRDQLAWYFAARDAGMPALVVAEWWEAMYLRYFTPPAGGA